MTASARFARLLTAYRSLCDRNRALALVALLGLTVDSTLALLVTAFWFPRWAPLPALILIVSGLLLHMAPDGDESDGDS